MVIVFVRTKCIGTSAMGQEVKGTVDTRNFTNKLCHKNNGGVRYRSYICILLIVRLTFVSVVF